MRHRSPHWIMREAIRDYVEREEAREALGSGTVFKDTAFHLSIEEVHDWLGTWVVQSC